MSYEADQDLDQNPGWENEEDPNDEGRIPQLELEFKGEKGWVRFRSIGDLSGRHLEELRLAAGLDGSRGAAANALYAKALEMLVEAWEIPTKTLLPVPRGPNGKRHLQQVPLILLRRIERYVMVHLDPWLNEREGDGGSPSLPARG